MTNLIEVIPLLYLLQKLVFNQATLLFSKMPSTQLLMSDPDSLAIRSTLHEH
jgi:hypothetical protein